ncbi:hypothetical protein JTB14_009548 [Gonioctena quinquepunctata]|nr:hypothetical protein JTB14_009548 [Gonioctena quinquepunctata]
MVLVYIPPNSSYDEYDEFLKCLGNIQSDIILANFNIPVLQNFNDTKLRSNLIFRLNNFLNYCDMTQNNTVKNHNNRLLDLVISNSESVCEVLPDEDPLV